MGSQSTRFTYLLAWFCPRPVLGPFSLLTMAGRVVNMFGAEKKNHPHTCLVSDLLEDVQNAVHVGDDVEAALPSSSDLVALSGLSNDSAELRSNETGCPAHLSLRTWKSRLKVIVWRQDLDTAFFMAASGIPRFTTFEIAFEITFEIEGPRILTCCLLVSRWYGERRWNRRGLRNPAFWVCESSHTLKITRKSPT